MTCKEREAVEEGRIRSGTAHDAVNKYEVPASYLPVHAGWWMMEAPRQGYRPQLPSKRESFLPDHQTFRSVFLHLHPVRLGVRVCTSDGDDRRVELRERTSVRAGA